MPLDMQKTFALVVGVGEYANLPGIPNPAADAVKFMQMLKSAGVNTRDNTKLITDQSATLERIGQGFEWLKGRLVEDSTLIFFFAGHGLHSLESHRGGFLGLYHTDPDDLITALSINDLNQWLRTAAAGQASKLMMFIDCAYAGDILKPGLLGGLLKDDFDALFYMPGLNRALFASALSSHLSYVLPSQNNEVIHSLFVICLDEAMKGWKLQPNREHISSADIETYLDSELRVRGGGPAPKILITGVGFDAFPNPAYPGGASHPATYPKQGRLPILIYKQGFMKRMGSRAADWLKAHPNVAKTALLGGLVAGAFSIGPAVGLATAFTTVTSGISTNLLSNYLQTRVDAVRNGLSSEQLAQDIQDEMLSEPAFGKAVLAFVLQLDPAQIITTISQQEGRTRELITAYTKELHRELEQIGASQDENAQAIVASLNLITETVQVIDARTITIERTTESIQESNKSILDVVEMILAQVKATDEYKRNTPFTQSQEDMLRTLISGLVNAKAEELKSGPQTENTVTGTQNNVGGNQINFIFNFIVSEPSVRTPIPPVVRNPAPPAPIPTPGGTRNYIMTDLISLTSDMPVEEVTHWCTAMFERVDNGNGFLYNSIQGGTLSATRQNLINKASSRRKLEVLIESLKIAAPYLLRDNYNQWLARAREADSRGR